MPDKSKKSIQITSEIEELLAELEWFRSTMHYRLDAHRENRLPRIEEIPPAPVLEEKTSPFARKIHDLGFSQAERLVLAGILAAEIRPGIWLEIGQKSVGIPEIGLLPGQARDLMHVSARTVVFMASGFNLGTLPEAFQYFAPTHPFTKNHIIVQQRLPGAGFMETRITLRREFLHLILTGEEIRPDFSSDFPAHLMETPLTWDDLVLPGRATTQVNEIRIWLRHGKGIMEDWGMSRILKKGYRTLFHGPPGTGKTLTAQLLGKETGRDVYRIDLSQIASKYIGETEKNLARLFDLAEGKDWILFFDEADSIFGARGKVNDARDRYANQEVSYLLQRVEDYDGLCILATNQKSSIDFAFSRRLQNIISFSKPDIEQRFQLWRKALPKACTLEETISIRRISEKYELAGGSIINVVAHAALMAREKGGTIIYEKDLMDGIQREYFKEGKLI